MHACSFDFGRFEVIMGKHHERHLEKYGWVEDKAKEAEVLLLEAADPSGTRGSVQTWKYSVRNQLMYVPDGVDPLYVKPDDSKGPPKAILHSNTRITGILGAQEQL